MVQLRKYSASSASSSQIDVLIVGAGPAGIMSSLWLSAFHGLKVRIIDKRSNGLYAGQADGLVGRTQEVFNSFGFEDRILKICQPMAEFSFWEPNGHGVLHRSSRTADGPPNSSRFQGAVLHQGYIEAYMKDAVKERHGAEIEYAVQPDLLTIDESQVEDPNAYPITVRLRHLSDAEASPAQFGHKTSNGLFRSTNFVTEDEEDHAIRNPKAGRQETLQCKYVFGCDGAHSWVRRQIGYNMVGDQTDFIWGVLDILPLTNFPDIRSRCSIHSANSGSLMVIPRENEMVRLYIQLEDLEKNAEGKVERTKITPEQILNAAKKIMAPYVIDYDVCEWFTAYQVGQRVSDGFSKLDRVFIMGDACHTHSPKAGQGMNVSLMDAYNLGWKVASVIKGRSPRSILATYQSERRKVATQLITFDRKFSVLFSSKPSKAADIAADVAKSADISLDEFKTTFEKAKLFVAGVTVDYGSSVLVAKNSAEKDVASIQPSTVQGKQELATGIPLGMRLPSFRVLNQADCRSWWLQDRLPSDGRWRLVVFAGRLTNPAQRSRVEAFAGYLETPTSFINRYKPNDEELFDIITVHSGPRVDVELASFPSPLRRAHEYNKIFVDDYSYHEPYGNAYVNYGIDVVRGAVVFVRPDQYVCWIGNFEDMSDLERFCADCFVLQ